MKSRCFAALGGIVAAMLIPHASPAADMASAADRTFVAMVSQGGMFEVALGKVAQTQGSTQDIRDQGTTEVHDHLLVGAKLKAVAGAAGITFPSTLNSMFSHKLAALGALSGHAFDAAYLQTMGDIHAKDGAAFAKEAGGGTDSKLRAFAAETHRIVLRHIGEVNAIGP
jgi:putative membrane protein